MAAAEPDIGRFLVELVPSDRRVISVTVLFGNFTTTGEEPIALPIFSPLTPAPEEPEPEEPELEEPPEEPEPEELELDEPVPGVNMAEAMGPPVR